MQRTIYPFFLLHGLRQGLVPAIGCWGKQRRGPWSYFASSTRCWDISNAACLVRTRARQYRLRWGWRSQWNLQEVFHTTRIARNLCTRNLCGLSLAYNIVVALTMNILIFTLLFRHHAAHTAALHLPWVCITRRYFSDVGYCSWSWG